MLDASILQTLDATRLCSVTGCCGERVVTQHEIIGGQHVLVFNLESLDAVWTMHASDIPQRLFWPPKQFATALSPSVEYKTGLISNVFMGYSSYFLVLTDINFSV